MRCPQVWAGTRGWPPALSVTRPCDKKQCPPHKEERRPSPRTPTTGLALGGFHVFPILSVLKEKGVWAAGVLESARAGFLQNKGQVESSLCAPWARERPSSAQGSHPHPPTCLQEPPPSLTPGGGDMDGNVPFSLHHRHSSIFTSPLPLFFWYEYCDYYMCAHKNIKHYLRSK